MGGCKGSSADLVPLGSRCHRLLDDHCGSPEVFLARTGVDLVAIAAELEASWQELQRLQNLGDCDKVDSGTREEDLRQAAVVVE